MAGSSSRRYSLLLGQDHVHRIIITLRLLRTGCLWLLLLLHIHVQVKIYIHIQIHLLLTLTTRCGLSLLLLKLINEISGLLLLLACRIR